MLTLFALAGALIVDSSLAVQSTGCTRYHSPHLWKSVTYCLERSRPDLPVTRGEPVVYYMHGISEDHTHWVVEGYSESVARVRTRESLPPMTFISFDTHSQSYFTDRGGSKTGKHAYATWFVREFMPKMEKEHGVCARSECRGLMGHSMGGLGALHTALRNPGMFSVVAVNAPAIAPFNVFRGVREWASYFKRHPIPLYHGLALIWDTRRAFVTPDNFDAYYPPALVRNYPEGVPFPKIYFDVGGKDYYGFQEGYALFARELDRRGVAYASDFHPLGEHDIRRVHGRRENALRAIIEHLR